MFVILVYDVHKKRVAKVLKVCRKYLMHVQKSVFEGRITDASLRRLKQELSDTVESKEDSICIYCLESPKYTRKECIGIQEHTSNII
jgi:CRISPR-associated protein Cas2